MQKTLYYSTAKKSGQIASIDIDQNCQIPVSLNNTQARPISQFVRKEIQKDIEGDYILFDYDGWGAFIYREDFPAWIENMLNELDAKREAIINGN